MLCFLSTAGAQSITGKWKCSEDFLNSLGISIMYKSMKGYYKFKKDSTFTAIINGENVKSRMRKFGNKMYYTRRRTIYIKVKGTYSMTDSTITTTVKPENIFCYVDAGERVQEMPTANEATRGGIYKI